MAMRTVKLIALVPLLCGSTQGREVVLDTDSGEPARVVLSLGMRGDIGIDRDAPGGEGYRLRAYVGGARLWFFGGVEYMPAAEIAGQDIGQVYTYEMGLRFPSGDDRMSGWVELGLALIQQTEEPEQWGASRSSAGLMAGFGFNYRIDRDWSLDIGWHGLVKPGSCEGRVYLNSVPREDYLRWQLRRIDLVPGLNHPYIQMSWTAMMRFVIL